MAGNEKENLYLQLVDMFMDVVEPSIIQMVLQNQNWDCKYLTAMIFFLKRY